MSQSASQAAAFYRDVAKCRRVWTLEDDAGYPALLCQTGRRVMPFWSSFSRAERIVHSAPAFAGFRIAEFSWDDFKAYWVKELTTAGQLVGVNWSGKRAVGLDIEPQDVVRNVEHHIAKTRNLLHFPSPDRQES